MRDQIKISIQYFRLKKYFMEQLHYSERAAIQSIDDIRNMDPVVRKAFIVWFTTGKLPQGELCGIHYSNLVTYKNMNPVAAFLAIDWYVKEPHAAYAAIAVPLKDQGNMIVDTADRIRPCADPMDATPENTEDIAE